MLGRCLYSSRCSAGCTSGHSSFRPSLSALHVPIQWNSLGRTFWLSIRPLPWSSVICGAKYYITNYTGGSLVSWLSLRGLKRKRIAKAANREFDSDPPTTATILYSTLKCRYHVAKEIREDTYRNPCFVWEPLIGAEIDTVDGGRAQSLRNPRNHAFTGKLAGTVSFSTIATPGTDLRDHGLVNQPGIAPQTTMVRRKGLRKVKVPCSRRSSVRRKARKSVTRKVRKRPAADNERFDRLLDRWSTALDRWSTALAQIRALHSSQMLIEETSESTSLLVKHNSELVNSEDPVELWIAKSRRHKYSTWERILIPTLRDRPSFVLKILTANQQSSGHFLPRWVVEDCLDHLALLYLNRSTCTSSTHFHRIYSITNDYLETSGQRGASVSLSQRTIDLLSRHSDADQLILLLEKLNKHRVFIHTDTKLLIMPKLVEYGKIGLALSMLKSMPARDLLLFKVQKFCVMLLRAKLDVQNLYRLRSNAFAFMLEAGVRPNRVLVDVIILNAAEAGDLSTAWRSHTIAKDNGLKPSNFTYCALLKGARHRKGILTVRIVHRDAKVDGWLFKSNQLKFELLYAYYVSNNGKHHHEPYSILLPYYRQLFDVKPLQELGIFQSTGRCIDEEERMPQPTVPALGLILLAWLTENYNNESVLEVYKRYRYHTQHNQSLIAQLARSQHTANAFMVAFGKSPRTVHICTQIVQDMLKPPVVRVDTLKSLPSTSSVSHSNEDSSEHAFNDAISEYASNKDLDNYNIRRIAPPSVQTWSILSFALIKNGHSNAAEKVIALMEARGQKPSDVTWNSLLSGYAELQDFPGIIHTLQRMEQAGFEHDHWTTKALARVVDREALLRSLEESTKDNVDDTNGE